MGSLVDDLFLSLVRWSGGGSVIDRTLRKPMQLYSSLGNGMDAVVDKLARRRWRSMKRGIHQRIKHDYKGGLRVKRVLKHLHTRLHLARVVDALTVGIIG